MRNASVGYINKADSALAFGGVARGMVRQICNDSVPPKRRRNNRVGSLPFQGASAGAVAFAH